MARLEQIELQDAIAEWFEGTTEEYTVSQVMMQFTENTMNEIIKAVSTLSKTGVLYRTENKGVAMYGYAGKESTDTNGDFMELDVNGTKVNARIFTIGGDELDDEEQQGDSLSFSISLDKLQGYMDTYEKETDYEKFEEDIPDSNNGCVVSNKIEEVKFTYDLNRSVRCNGAYILPIPDCFTITKESNREFVAYMNNPKNNWRYNDGGAYITIYQHGGELCDSELASTEFSELSMQRYMAAANLILAEKFGTANIFRSTFKYSKIFATDAGLCYYFKDTVRHRHYNFHLFSYDRKYQIRVQLDNMSGSEEAAHELVVDLIKKIQFDKPLTQCRRLNGSEFVDGKFTTKKADEWIEILQNRDKEIGIYWSATCGIEVGKENPDKKIIDMYINTAVEDTNVLCKEIIDSFNKLKDDAETKALTKLYSAIDTFVEIKKCFSVELSSGEVIKKSPSKIKDVKSILKDPIFDSISGEIAQVCLKNRKADLDEWLKEQKTKYSCNKEGKNFVRKLKNTYKNIREEYDLFSSYTQVSRDVVYSDSMYPNEVENFFIEAVNEYNEFEYDQIHPEVVIEIMEQLKNIAERMDHCYIAVGVCDTQKYEFVVDLKKMRKRFVEIIKESRNNLSKLEKEQEKNKKELLDIEYALKYGITIEDIQNHRIYVDACDTMNGAKTEKGYKEAVALFEKCKAYKDSEEKIVECKSLGKKLQDKKKAEKEYQDAQKIVSDMETEYANILVDLPKKEKELEELSENLQNIKDSASDRKNEVQEALLHGLSDIDAQIKQERKAITDKNTRKNELREKIDRTMGLLFWVISKLEKEVTALAEEVKKSEAHILTLEKQKNDLEASARDKCYAIDNEISEMEKRIRNLEKNINQWQEKKNYAEENLNAFKKRAEEKRSIFEEMV